MLPQLFGHPTRLPRQPPEEFLLWKESHAKDLGQTPPTLFFITLLPQREPWDLPIPVIEGTLAGRVQKIKVWSMHSSRTVRIVLENGKQGLLVQMHSLTF